MPSPRPVECPECGHEGISRADPWSERRSAGAASSETWRCRLCAYTWQQPASARRPPPLDWPEAS